MKFAMSALAFLFCSAALASGPSYSTEEVVGFSGVGVESDDILACTSAKAEALKNGFNAQNDKYTTYNCDQNAVSSTCDCYATNLGKTQCSYKATVICEVEVWYP